MIILPKDIWPGVSKLECKCVIFSVDKRLIIQKKLFLVFNLNTDLS